MESSGYVELAAKKTVEAVKRERIHMFFCLWKSHLRQCTKEGKRKKDTTTVQHNL